jgi:type III secretion control protein HpaP
MYAVHALPVRVLPGALPGGYPSQAARRGDYDALVRLARRGPVRARAWREASGEGLTGERPGYASGGEACNDHNPDGSDRALEPSSSLRERAQTPMAARHLPARTAVAARPDAQPRTSIERRLEALAAPCVGAIAELRQEFDGWVQFLVERAADFCSDRAVGAQGHWDVRLTLDPAILPDCTLRLSLSHFTLALRFETQTNASRQLVLHHEQTLKAQLADVLAQRGEPREIEIAVD